MTRITGTAASVSWIDAASPAGAHVPDPDPGATITEGFVTGNSGFRFSNYLNAWVESDDGTRLTANGFAANSRMYRGPSYLGIDSLAYPTRQERSAFNEGGVDGIEFTQLTGARTVSPAAIGGAVGGGVGAVGGAVIGAKGGAAIGLFGGPPGAAVGGVVGGLIGLGIGYFAGSGVANAVTNFPPIWTRIKLRIKANGQKSHQMVEHSHFPSNSFYADFSRVRTYSAMATEQTLWENRGWDAGNPWGVSRPVVGQ